MPVLLDLFLTFAKIGLFTFGGGYAMIALIEDICVEKKRWITHDEMMNITVIAESTPGPIAVNCATYVGYRRAGVGGGVCATLGVILPSFAIIYVISLFFERFMSLTIAANAFKGIQMAVAFLVLRAGIRMARRVPRKGLEIGLSVAAGAAVLAINALGWRFSTIWLILFGGVVGLLFRRAAKPDKEGAP